MNRVVAGLLLVLTTAVGQRAAASTEVPSSVVWAPPPPIQFELGSAVVPPGARSTLRSLAATARPRGVRLHLTGFADTRGAADANRELSRRRAIAVKRALVELGVAERQIIVTAHGETVGGARARRVELGVSMEGPATFRAVPFGSGRVRLVIYLRDGVARTARLRVLQRAQVVGEATVATPHRIDVADVAQLLQRRVDGPADLEVLVSPDGGHWPVVAIEDASGIVKRILPE